MSTAGRKPSGEPLFQKLSFLLILGAISAVFLFMVRNFLLTMLMAGVFTGLSHPIYQWLLLRIKRRALASVLTLLLLLLVLVLPASAVIITAYHEAWNFFGSVDFTALPATLEHWASNVQARFPSIFAHMSPQDVSQATTQGLQQVFQFILKHGADWSVLLAGNVANFFFMLIMMFYFYMDGKQILRKLIHWSPLRDDYEEVLLENFLSVSRATLKGILVVGITQGAIGTTLYWLVGLKSAVFLGVLMIFCSVIPVAGTSIIWIPTAIYLFIQNHFGAGLAVVITGVLVISTVDNFLRPMLVGKDIKMHDLMVLFSTLGGIGLFGLPGFVMGPVLASLFLSIWTMYEEVFAAELSHNRIRVQESPSSDASA